MKQDDSLALALAANQFAENDGFAHIKEITIVIPALNEFENLKQILPHIPDQVCGLKTGVLLVDDGSSDQTKDLGKLYNIGLATISTTLGQGAALCLGYKLALRGEAQIIITMDADGQHRPEEIERLVEPIVSGAADFVIGSRILGQFERSDPIRLAGLRIFSRLLSLMLNMKITDCSSGFRAMKANVLEVIIPHLVQKQFATTELIISIAKKRFRITEVPATILPRISGKSKKGNNLYFGLSFAKAMCLSWLKENQPIGGKYFSWLSAITIFSAMLLASYWVFLVPIFQSPDEDYHADYMFSLYSKKRLIRGSKAPIAACSHPYIPYLFQATNGQAAKWTSFAKIPVDYGKGEFFQNIDRNAPDEQTCVNTNTNPVLVAVYPVGYYALTALWLSAVSVFNNRLIFLFFAARFLSVILLGCGLTLSYLTMRELRFSYMQSLLVLAAIGFFPTVSLVGSYIQPDNLSFVAISACFLFALRWRNNAVSGYKERAGKMGAGNVLLQALSVALAILLLSKYQFFCCAGLAILAMIIARAMRSKISFAKLLGILATIIVPSIMAAMLQLWISWHCHLPVIDDKHRHWFPVDTVFKEAIKSGKRVVFAHIANALQYAYHSFYRIDGQTFKSFWGCFGQCLSVPLVIGTIEINDALRKTIEFVTEIIILLTVLSLIKVSMRLLYLVKKGRFSSAFYIACSNPVINSYFLFVIFMFLLMIIVYPSWPGQGRQWIPLILSIVLTAASFASQIFSSRRIRKRFFFVIVISWLTYSVIGSYYAIGCIYKRYYQADKQPRINLEQLISSHIPSTCRILHCDFLDAVTSFNRHLNTLIMPRGTDMHIVGWAIDTPARSPASAVFVYIDNSKIYRTTYGLESIEAMKDLHSKNYRFCEFAALIPTNDLTAGKHSLSIKVVSRDGHLLYDTDAKLIFIVL